LLAHKHTQQHTIMGLVCRYAVANITMTQEYLQSAQQVMCRHDRANKQAEMDVTPAMGDMLIKMQGCLRQRLGESVLGIPEAVAGLCAERMAALNISPDHNIVQDNCDVVLALTAHVEMAAPKGHVEFSTEAQGCTAGLIQAPALYGTSSNISSVQHAWSE